jgi:hypothetical protein
MSLALNVILTILIVGRLMLFRYRIRKMMCSNVNGSQYISVAAMLVESAAMYSSFSIAFLVPFGLNSPLAELFLQALGQVQVSACFPNGE